jgi:hypothetical protein
MIKRKYFFCINNLTFSLLITPFEVNISRPSHGFSQKSSDVGSDFLIRFGNLNH